MALSYSIIIPHYNQADRLRVCLSSIVQRDDIEVIVVDDASSAACIAKLKSIEQEFAHTKLIFADRNGGAGKVRNIGLGVAHGERIIFADADDRFLAGFDDFLTRNIGNDADVIYFNAAYEATEGGKLFYKSSNLNYIMSKEGQRREWELRYLFTEPWCKAVKRSLIEENGIRFEETRIHNDVHFSAAVGVTASSIDVEAKPLYCVTETPGSVAKQISHEKMLDWTRVQTRLNLYLSANGIGMFEYKALRPMITSVVKGRWGEAADHWKVMREEGMEKGEIAKRTALYLIAAVRKGLRNHEKKKHVIWSDTL